MTTERGWTAYGTIDPSVEEIGSETETLLGLCRMLHLNYDIKKIDGKFYVKLNCRNWPGDFFGLNPNGERSYSYGGHVDLVGAIKVVIKMAHSGLWTSCEY